MRGFYFLSIGLIKEGNGIDVSCKNKLLYMKIPLLLGYLFILFVGLPACKTIQANKASGGNYCAPSVPYNYEGQRRPEWNSDSLITAYATLPAHEVIIANAAGILPLVQQLATAGNDSSVTARLRKVELRSQIQRGVLLASIEIAEVAAELDCEGERADQLGRYLDGLNSKSNTWLTVSSIVTGAITTVATVFINNKGVQNTVAISGGLLTAGLGALTINPGGRKMTVTHPRNLLADIWYKPTVSVVYSPFIWYVLNEKRFSYSGKASLAENTKRRWLEFDFDNAVDADKEKLFFGAGGSYKAGDLHARAAMLNELQATIRSINQDLQSLMEYIGQIH